MIMVGMCFLCDRKSRKVGFCDTHYRQYKYGTFEEQRTCCDCGDDFVASGLQTQKKRCEACSWVTCLNCGSLTRKKLASTRYCNMQCRVEHQHKAKLCPCGVEIPRGTKGNARKKYCSDECRIKFVDYGQYGKLTKGVSKGKGRKQSPEHIRKRMLGTQASGRGSRPSKEELSLIPTLAKFGFRHTGYGAFWRRWPDGTTHNPDYVNEDERIVFEYFGAHWHKDDRGREDYIREQWAAIGYECFIVWSEDREAFLDDPTVFVGAVS